eukprot:GHVU01146160.1.p1 GENE.GHVU01146160.1~~GHVU01146160.1.p1  ORF type:complete len:179 (+),score=8.09 GHVU01146160.1:121-657(+)
MSQRTNECMNQRNLDATGVGRMTNRRVESLATDIGYVSAAVEPSDGWYPPTEMANFKATHPSWMIQRTLSVLAEVQSLNKSTGLVSVIASCRDPRLLMHSNYPFDSASSQARQRASAQPFPSSRNNVPGMPHRPRGALAVGLQQWAGIRIEKQAPRGSPAGSPPPAPLYHRLGCRWRQ